MACPGGAEFLGWLDLIGGVIVGIAIAAEDSNDAFGETSSGDNAAAGFAVVARALRLFAEYVAARTGTDLDALVPPDRSTEGGGIWAADPTGRHQFRYWDGGW